MNNQSPNKTQLSRPGEKEERETRHKAQRKQQCGVGQANTRSANAESRLDVSDRLCNRLGRKLRRTAQSSLAVEALSHQTSARPRRAQQIRLAADVSVAGCLSALQAKADGQTRCDGAQTIRNTARQSDGSPSG